MIFKVSPPTFTVVGIVVPPMGAAAYVHVPSELGVSTVSTLTRFGIRLLLLLLTDLLSDPQRYYVDSLMSEQLSRTPQHSDAGTST